MHPPLPLHLRRRGGQLPLVSSSSLAVLFSPRIGHGSGRGRSATAPTDHACAAVAGLRKTGRLPCHEQGCGEGGGRDRLFCKSSVFGLLPHPTTTAPSLFCFLRAHIPSLQRRMCGVDRWAVDEWNLDWVIRCNKSDGSAVRVKLIKRATSAGSSRPGPNHQNIMPSLLQRCRDTSPSCGPHFHPLSSSPLVFPFPDPDPWQQNT